MKLYELSEKYNNLINILNDDEIDLQESDLKTELNEIQTQFNDKAENIGKLILSLDSEALCIKNEIERLNKRKASAERKVEWLKSYLLNEMIVSKQDKIEGKLLTLSLRKNPPSCVIPNMDLVPQEFRRVIPETWQPDKKSIIDLFKQTGEIFDWCDVITDKKSLSIK
jgi:hypothetical protein